MPHATNLHYPFNLHELVWLKAIQIVPDGWRLSPEAERYAVGRYVQRHQLVLGRTEKAIRAIVLLFKARILLRFKNGLSTSDIEQEYGPYGEMIFRESNYNKSLGIGLDYLEEGDVVPVIETLQELVALGSEPHLTAERSR